MRATAMPLIMLARVCFVALLGMGILFWTGHMMPGLFSLTIAVGLIFVMTLWALAALALITGTGGAIAWLAIAWGLLMLLLGFTQASILPGDMHLAVQIVHLLVGIAGLAFAEDLARRIRRPQGVAF
jgi:hypothetical protein